MQQKVGTLYLVGGKIASGKTTLARKLATQRNAAMICEDEWLALFEASFETVDDYLIHSRRLRAALKAGLAPHVVCLLKLGTSVVLDFPANTLEWRAWMRSLFDGAKARHELHYIDAPDDLCQSRLRARNEAKPEGLYWGHVPESRFDSITRYIVPPSEAEGFNVVWHDARPA